MRASARKPDATGWRLFMKIPKRINYRLVQKRLDIAYKTGASVYIWTKVLNAIIDLLSMALNYRSCEKTYAAIPEVGFKI